MNSIARSFTPEIRRDRSTLQQFLQLFPFNKKEKEKISLVYKYAKILHHGQTRKDGTEYFEHPKATAEILKEIDAQNPKSVKIALLHDVLEDTEVEYEIIQDLFGEEIADAVNSISKKPILHYIEGRGSKSAKTRKSFKEQVQSIIEPELPIIIDTSNFQELRQRYYNLIHNSDTRVIHFYIVGVSLSPLIMRSLASFCKKEKKVMKISFKEKKRHISSKTAEEKQRRERYNEHKKEIELSSNDAFNVKCADRLHNLRTMKSCDSTHKSKKIQETEDDLMPLALMRNRKAYKLLKIEVDRLKKEVFDTTGDTIKERIRKALAA